MMLFVIQITQIIMSLFSDLMSEPRGLHEVGEKLGSVVANVESVLCGAEVVLPGCKGAPLDEDYVEVPSLVEF